MKGELTTMSTNYNYVLFAGSLRHLVEATLAFEQTFQLNCNARPLKTITTPKGNKLMVFPKISYDFNKFFTEAVEELKEREYNGIIPRIVIPT